MTRTPEDNDHAQGLACARGATVRHARDRRYNFYQLGADGVVSLRCIHAFVSVTPDRRDAMIEAVARYQRHSSEGRS